MQRRNVLDADFIAVLVKSRKERADLKHLSHDKRPDVAVENQEAGGFEEKVNSRIFILPILCLHPDSPPFPLSFSKERGEFRWRGHLYFTTAIGSGFLRRSKRLPYPQSIP